jgi:hypothetical protein
LLKKLYSIDTLLPISGCVFHLSVLAELGFDNVNVKATAWSISKVSPENRGFQMLYFLLCSCVLMLKPLQFIFVKCIVASLLQI